MIYVLFLLSLIINGILIWYIRKLLAKYWFDVEAREKFSIMITDYAQSLDNLSRLEELYGEEIIKKAVEEARFIQEACKEFKKILEEGVTEDKEDEQTSKEAGKTEENSEDKKGPIYLKEGEAVSQDGANYRRVIRKD